MKKYVNGQYIEMTEEEIAELQDEQPVEEQKPSVDERLEFIEQGFKRIENILSKLGVK